MGFRRKLSLAFLLGCIGNAEAADRWTAVVDPADGKYLYLDDRGSITIPGPFIQAESFSGALGRVSGLETTLYLKPDGKAAFEWPGAFAETSRFFEGRAAFLRAGLVGFINDQGQEAVTPRYLPIMEAVGTEVRWVPPFFQDGVTVVGLPPVFGWAKANGTLVESPTLPLAFVQGFSFLPVAGGYSLIDGEGTPVVPTVFESATPFSEGLAPVSVEGKTGWVDATGKILPFDGTLGPFVGGYAVVQRAGFAGLADKKGKEVLVADKYRELVPLHSLTDVFRVWKFRDKQKDKGPWGLVNERGQILAPAQWDSVSSFSEGQAVVTLGSQSGFVNAKGILVAPLSELVLGPLKEGLAVVRRGELFGFADSRGKVVLPAQWSAAGDFSSGLAAVSTAGLWGLIDKKGKPGASGYQALGPLASKRRAFLKDGKAGYLDEKGAVAIPAVYERAGDFQGGLAWVYQEGRGRLITPEGKDFGPAGFEPVPNDQGPPIRLIKPTRFGLIDKAGEFVVPPLYDSLVSSVGGPLLAVRSAGSPGSPTYIDRQGAPTFALVGWVPFSAFQEGRAFVREASADTPVLGVIDDRGTLLARGFRAIRGGFQEGRACVQFSTGKWGYIDATGKPLFDLQWDDALAFSEGFAAVAFDGAWGYIDSQGTKIIPYQYSRATEFHNGLAAVSVGESAAYITKTGQRVWP